MVVFQTCSKSSFAILEDISPASKKDKISFKLIEETGLSFIEIPSLFNLPKSSLITQFAANLPVFFVDTCSKKLAVFFSEVNTSAS